jgi:hypothetical protein
LILQNALPLQIPQPPPPGPKHEAFMFLTALASNIGFLKVKCPLLKHNFLDKCPATRRKK